MADIEKLRSIGDKIPKKEKYILYRGVAGRNKARKVMGVSWTDSVYAAAWFARRFKDLPDPSVFKVEVSYNDIYAKLDGRNESEYLIRVSQRPKRISKDLMETAYLTVGCSSVECGSPVKTPARS